MRFFPCENTAKAPRIFWFVLLSAIWLWWTIPQAKQAGDAKRAELATRNWFMRWWDNDLPGKAEAQVGDRQVGGICLAWVVAHFIGIMQANITQSVAENLRNKRDQRAFATMDRDNDSKAQVSKAAQSKQELIMRLGNIDQYVRVLAIETDVPARTVALQAAHSEMTTLAARLASEQINRKRPTRPLLTRLCVGSDPGA